MYCQNGWQRLEKPHGEPWGFSQGKGIKGKDVRLQDTIVATLAPQNLAAATSLGTDY